MICWCFFFYMYIFLESVIYWMFVSALTNVNTTKKINNKT